MRIYIRHAEKEYSNGESEIYKHDPNITNNGREKARRVAKFLIDKWGVPDMIVCSPYERTRETAKEMASIIDKDIKIKCDVRLSEYLGNHKEDELDVKRETEKYNPPHPEIFFEMDSRVLLHNDEMQELDDSEMIVWFITHGIIINRIANAMGFTLKRRFPYLGAITFIKENNYVECYIIINENIKNIYIDNNEKKIFDNYFKKYNKRRYFNKSYFDIN